MTPSEFRVPLLTEYSTSIPTLARNFLPWDPGGLPSEHHYRFNLTNCLFARRFLFLFLVFLMLR